MQNSYEIKRLSQTPHLFKSLFSSKATVMFSCTVSLSVFLSLLKSATLFFCSFPQALCTIWPSIIPHVLFFVTSLVLLQSRSLNAKEGEFLGRTSSPERRSMYQHANFVVSSQRQCIFLKTNKQTNKIKQLSKNDQCILMVPLFQGKNILLICSIRGRAAVFPQSYCCHTEGVNAVCFWF